MKESKALNNLILILKIILCVALIASFLFFTSTLISAHLDSIAMEEQPSDGTIRLDPFPIAFTIVLIFSIITNCACLFFALVGFIVSYLYRASQKRRTHLITFGTLIAVPVLLEIFYILYYYIAK